MRALWVLTVFSLLSLSSAFEVSPSNPNPGDTIILTGSSSPNETVSLRSSFSMNLPVSAGQYDYVTRVTIPQTPNRITISARNVKDFNAGVKLGIWITKGFSASGGTVSLSQSDLPPGSYNLKMFGEALPGSTAVAVSVEAETEVKSDSQGRYVLDIDTSGIPAGEYRIEAAGETKTIQIGTTSTSSSSSHNIGSLKETNAEMNAASTAAKKVDITPEVVRWYANETGLKIENLSQLYEAELLLKKRLSDGYWKIIGRGEPLTEEAGNCLQEYCLVRGNGACTTCREKDILLKESSVTNASNKEKGLRSSESQDQSALEPNQETGFWSKIIQWIGRWLGIPILAGAVSNSRA